VVVSEGIVCEEGGCGVGSVIGSIGVGTGASVIGAGGGFGAALFFFGLVLFAVRFAFFFAPFLATRFFA